MKEKIQQIIYEVIDENNDQQPDDLQLAKELDTPLYGGEGNLDSLGLVNVVVSIEQKIKAEFGKTVTVADERVMSLATTSRPSFALDTFLPL